MFVNFPEILAPVGGEEQLIAAIKAGANAVYFGGTSFGARSSAKNFSREQIERAVRYAHLHGVSVYITVNTLILDSEFDAAMDFIDFLYRSDVDAVIVQDVGLAVAVRERYPDFPIHASTQMTFHNAAGVKYAKQFGFSRVVLPREMSAEEIRMIAEQVDIELEVFIHGALCVSYSGMCLMSSFIGGRSGNRGNCAQPCRKKYSLYSTDAEQTYRVEDARVISPKDLSVAANLDALLTIPKISLKIEGRLKDEFYVYNVVSAYRRLADGEIDASEAERLLQNSYHRGYTRGFVLNEDIRDFRAGDHTGHRGTYLGRAIAFRNRVLTVALADDLRKGDEVQFRKNDGTSVGARADRISCKGVSVDFAKKGEEVDIPFKFPVPKFSELYKTYSVAHISSVEEMLKAEVKRWGIILKVTAKRREPLSVGAYLTTRSGRKLLRVEKKGDPVQEATGRGTDSSRMAQQFFKFGGTPFEPNTEESTFEADEGIFVPIAEINGLRREIVEAMEAFLTHRYPSRIPDEVSIDSRNGGAAVHSEDCGAGLATSANSPNAVNSPKAVNSPNALVLPPIIPSSQWEEYRKRIESADCVEISHLSHLAFPELRGRTLRGAYTLNVLNSRALNFYIARGLSHVEISTEIGKEAIRTDNLCRIEGAASFGERRVREGITLMRMAYCPVGAYFGSGRHCGLCKKYRFVLKDEKNVVFPLKLDPSICMAEVLSPAGMQGSKMI